MKKVIVAIGVFAGFYACRKDTVPPLRPDVGEEYSGGAQNTVFDVSTNAFSMVSPGLNSADQLLFFVGNSFFKQNWVTAPSSTLARDGLGPTLNARSCAACHLKDGRGAPPATLGEVSTGLLIRLSIPGTDPHGGPNPVPNYGDQLNDQAIPNVTPEGQIAIAYTTLFGQFDNGDEYSLQSPAYSVANPGYGALPAGTMMSPRVGQQVIGLGLLEAIDEYQILAHADETDANNDGISGRPNYVWDIAAGRTRLGRFGWKANQPSLLQQSAGAFLGDIGITSYLFPAQNCTGIQTGCQNAPDGGSPEISDEDLHKMVVYISNLAVPARRDVSSQTVLQGKALFTRIGCAACHIPSYITGRHAAFSNLSGQTIWPYTDMLLHDMGEALADNRPDFLASGTEWRTPPLWGIGLIHTVNGHTRLLHDGRARNVEEAILWHGGEGQAAMLEYKRLSVTERNQLISFINSL